MSKMTDAERTLAAQFEPLRQSGWLALTPPAFQQEVLRHLSVTQFRRGQAIYAMNDLPAGLWGVIDGVVEFVVDEAPQTVAHAHYGGPGVWFGEGAFVTGASPRLTGKAYVPSTVAALSRENCLAILNADPQNWQYIALLASINRDSAVQRSRELLLKSADHRVAAALLRLCGAVVGFGHGPTTFDLPLGQKELADIANLSRPVVSSVLANFERAKIVSTGYRTVSITDWKALKAVLTRE